MEFLNNDDEPQYLETTNAADEKAKLGNIVKSQFAGLGIDNKDSKSPKSALAAFSKLMSDRMAEEKEVKTDHLKLEAEKFEHAKIFDEKRLDFEKEKVS